VTRDCLARNRTIQEKLETELARLKQQTGLGLDLVVRWIPNGSKTLDGEVSNGIIYVYSSNPDSAVQILVHEFFDYLLSLTVKPYEKATDYYRSMVNAVMQMLAKEAYTEKERVAEALKKAYLERNAYAKE
jgi:hypothetical protein